MELIEKYKNINKKLNKIIYVTTSGPVPELSYGQICFVYEDEDDSSFDLSIPDVENILVSDYQNSITRYL